MKKTSVVFIISLLLGTALLSAGDDFPEIKGWSKAGDVRTLTPDNLWEYIDGAAEQFINYGFKQLRYCDLSKDDITITVNIYDMGTPLNGFGIYKAETSASAEHLSIGTVAVLSPPYQCQLLKDRYYVKIEAYDGEISRERGETICRALAAALPGKSDLPSEFSLLPRISRITGSESYAKHAFLGLAELHECVYADYRDGEKDSYRIFIMLTPDEKSREITWKKLAGKWDRSEIGNVSFLYREIPYEGFVGIINKEGRLLGIAGARDVSHLSELLSNLAD